MRQRSIMKYEALTSHMYGTMLAFFKGNESMKKEYIQQINHFHPVSSKKAFGEIKLVYAIVNLNQSNLNFFHLEMINSYVRNILKEMKSSIKTFFYKNDIFSKIYYLLKLILILAKNRKLLDE